MFINNPICFHYFFRFPVLESNKQQRASMLQINNKEREELLHLACQNGQFSLIKNLLKAKVDIDAFNTEGLSPLHIAVIKGNIEVAKLLISEGASIDLNDSKWGSSPLLYACQNGRTKIVKMLLENGSDINAKSDEGSTAIHFAAQSGKPELIDFLLQKGFDINCENDFLETPLHKTLLHWRYPSGKSTSLYEKVKLIIEKGGNINSIESENVTPLMYAIMAHDVSVVKLFISLGANVNHGQNDNKLTPLHCAAYFKGEEHEKMIQALIKNGAKINAVGGSKLMTPLHSNVFNKGAIESARALLENGASLTMKDHQNNTALQQAIKYGNTKFIKLVLELQPSLVASLNTSRDFPIEYALELQDESALKMITYHCHKYAFI